jgi:hypothetical protein
LARTDFGATYLLGCGGDEDLVGVHEFHVLDFCVYAQPLELAFFASGSAGCEAEQVLIREVRLHLVEIGLEGNRSGD